jgi:hypothetical protein
VGGGGGGAPFNPRASIGGMSLMAAAAAMAAAAGPHHQQASDSPCGSPTLGAGSDPSASAFQHTFRLEFPDLSKSDKSIGVRLLGPYTARLGESLALAWQLTRTGASSGSGAADVAAVADQEEEQIHFEVADRDGKGCWSSLLAGRGVVRLGRALGSVATVEAVVLPVAAGRCRPPELALSGPHKQRLVSEEEQSEGELVYVVHG